MENTRTFGIRIQHLFIDFRTTYDTINRKLLFAAMKEFNIPAKLIKLVKIILTNTKLRVQIQNNLSEPIVFLRGLRQRDATVGLVYFLIFPLQIHDHHFKKSLKK